MVRAGAGPAHAVAPLGALTLAALECLPCAHDATIVNAATGHALPVRHGSLLAYARALIEQHNEPALLFRLRFALTFGSAGPAEPPRAPAGVVGDPAALAASAQTLDLNDPAVQQSIREGRIVIRM